MPMHTPAYHQIGYGMLPHPTFEPAIRKCVNELKDPEVSAEFVEALSRGEHDVARMGELGILLADVVRGRDAAVDELVEPLAALAWKIRECARQPPASCFAHDCERCTNRRDSSEERYCITSESPSRPDRHVGHGISHHIRRRQGGSHESKMASSVGANSWVVERIRESRLAEKQTEAAMQCLSAELGLDEHCNKIGTVPASELLGLVAEVVKCGSQLTRSNRGVAEHVVANDKAHLDHRAEASDANRDATLDSALSLSDARRLRITRMRRMADLAKHMLCKMNVSDHLRMDSARVETSATPLAHCAGRGSRATPTYVARTQRRMLWMACLGF